MSYQPLTQSQFQALRAAVDFSYYIEVGLMADTVSEALVSYYTKLSKSEDYQEWLRQQAWQFWQKRQAIESYLLKYMRQCEETGIFFSGATDELGERLYWRADGAADCLEHLLQEFGMEATK